MAGTKIDELVVELGLDVDKFIEGQKRALESAKQMQERLEQFGKNAEATASKASVAFGFLRGGIAGFATMLMAGAEKLADFAKQIIPADAASYRFSQTIGKSTKEVTAWDAVFQQFTGRAGSGAAMFDRLAQASANAFMRGDYGFFVTLQRMGVALRDITDSSGNITNTTELVLRMADAFSKMPRGAALGFAEALHIPTEDLFALEQGRAALEKLVAQKKLDIGVTDAQGKAAQEVTQRWNALTQSIESVGRALSYAIMDRLTQLADWFTSNTPIIDWFNRLADFILPRFREFREEAGKTAAGSTALAGRGSANMPLPDMSGSGGGVRSKAGAGDFTVGTYALASVLQQSVPGFNQVTAAQDEMHQGWDSAHNRGRALDFTVGGGRGNAAATAQGIREQLRAMGIDATVLDEYNHPSAHATAGHLHVQFNSEAAAQRFADMSGAKGSAGQTVNINQMTINTAATDAQGIASGIQGAIKRAGAGMPANGGFQ